MDIEQDRRAMQLYELANRVIDEGPLGWQTGLPVEVGDFRIEQRGFMRMGRRAAGHQEDAGTFPDGIDLFWRETKVLSVGESRTGDRCVFNYEPGDWEQELVFLLTPGHGRTQ